MMTMMYKNTLIALTFLLLFSGKVCSQDSIVVTNRTHTVSFKTQYIQIKDALNYGLVYSGPNLGVAYSYEKNTNTTLLIYSPEIYFGGLFNKGGGFSWRFKPIDIFYGGKLMSNQITIGGYFSTDYQWQQYPELQGGRLFWFSTIEIGPRIEYALPYKSGVLTINFSNSIAGFTSRPEYITETYYYEFSISEFISVANQNLTFGSFNLFNRTQFGATMKPNSWKRLTLGYSFEYFGYYKAPTLSFVSHSINLNWRL